LAVRQEIGKLPPATSAPPLPNQRTPRTPEEDYQNLLQKSKELDAINEECEALADELMRAQPSSARPAAPSEAELREIQRLQVEHEVRRNEIDSLQTLVQQRGSKGQVTSSAASTVMLSAEVERLKTQLIEEQRNNTEVRDMAAQNVSSIQTEIQNLRDQVRRALQEREFAAEVLGDLEQAQQQDFEEMRLPADDQGIAQEREDQQLRHDSLAKDLARSRRRIEFFDEKIQQLQTESEDIRRRALLVRKTVPDAPASGGEGVGGAESNERVVELQALLQKRQQQVQEMRRHEEQLQTAHAEAQRILENSRVESSVLEQQARLLQDRQAPVQAALDEARMQHQQQQQQTAQLQQDAQQALQMPPATSRTAFSSYGASCASRGGDSPWESPVHSTSR
jgi:chromosome segregation ATPase